MRILILSLIPLVAACAGTADPDGDPYESANRRVHAFNTGLDAHVVGPLTSPMKGGDDSDGPNGALVVLGNVGDNLSLPGKVVNGLLQGRPEAAARNGGRFVVNTLLGLGGIMDPAGQEFGLTEIDTDFGETLHVWGVPAGAYLELPVLGPSTGRDAVGKVVDWALDPLLHVLPADGAWTVAGIRILSKAGDRARFGDTVDSVLHQSADSYAQTRLLYQQHRAYELGEEGDVIDPYEDPYE